MNQKKLILEYFKRGKTLTPFEALSLFGCMRLTARVYELRESGHDIRSHIIKGPNGKHYAKYYLMNPNATQTNQLKTQEEKMNKKGELATGLVIILCVITGIAANALSSGQVKKPVFDKDKTVDTAEAPATPEWER